MIPLLWVFHREVFFDKNKNLTILSYLLSFGFFMQTKHSVQFSDPVQYIEFLNALMIEKNASDMYLTHGEPPALRILEEVERQHDLEKMTDESLNAIALTLLNKSGLEFFEKHGSIDLGVGYQDRRYRINISRQRGHIMIVARLLRRDVPQLSSLNLPAIFKELCFRDNGIVFLAGSTGSGKSTTLAAMVEEINMTQKKHILTIEDPIEYIFEPKKSIIDQKELGKDVCSFSSAMKYALRQRPDVILFGEIRDLDGIRNAILLSETGHLVLTTVHARSAEQVLNKIIGSFSADEQNQIRIQLAENISAIVVQKLLKRQDKPGLALAQEVLLNTTAVSNIIRENKLNQLKSIMYTSRPSGMQIMEESLLTLFSRGMISLEQALQSANNPEYIKRELLNR